MARNRLSGCRKGCGCFSVLLAASVAACAWFFVSLTPTPNGPPKYVRFEKRARLHDALARMEAEGVLKSATATEVVARFSGRPVEVQPGTYKVSPGMGSSEVLTALTKPVRLKVRLPEGWWIARTAKRLEETGVCRAEEYVEAATDPSMAAEFGIVAKGTLEGFLFPDTYDFAPQTPAKDVVRTLLRTFRKRVGGGDLRRTVTLASMVELEAARDDERAKIAGVFENRLKRGMTLDVDACVLYVLQEWKQLPPGYVKTVQSPYNTYLHKGLPPGPIGSPSLKSIVAAKQPDSHGYLYYVARPDRSHYFAATYPEHLKNIRKARLEWAAKRKP